MKEKSVCPLIFSWITNYMETGERRPIDHFLFIIRWLHFWGLSSYFCSPAKKFSSSMNCHSIFSCGMSTVQSNMCCCCCTFWMHVRQLNANYRVNGSYTELTTTTTDGRDSEWVEEIVVQMRMSKQLILSATAHGKSMSIINSYKNNSARFGMVTQTNKLLNSTKVSPLKMQMKWKECRISKYGSGIDWLHRFHSRPRRDW